MQDFLQGLSAVNVPFRASDENLAIINILAGILILMEAIASNRELQKREGWKKLVDTVDRVDGKALQPVEQTVNGYVPPTINIEFVKGDEDEE